MELTRRSFLLGLGAGALAGFSQSPLVFADELPHNLVSVANYGALPDGSDAGPGVRKAIAALPRKGGATLFFPPGQYRFKQKNGTAMLIEHVERLVLDGTGATFLMEGTTTALRVRHCEAPLIHGFIIDSDRPEFSQGEVLALRADARACEIRIDSEFPVTGHEPVMAVGTYDRRAPFATKEVESFYPVKSVSLMAPQILHLIFKWPQPQLTAGKTVVLRHSMYDGFGLTVGFCRSPRVQNVTIYSAPGMGLCGVCNENLAVDRLRIEHKPGSDRLISICADGIHNFSGVGKVSITNCMIKDSADDCINVTAQYLIVAKPVDARTLLIRKADKSPFNGTENDTPLPHTSYDLINSLTLEKLGEASLVASEIGQEATLHFDRDLPQLREGDLLLDNSHRAALTVSDCVFPGSRGRGVLAHNDVLIERCKFRNQGNEAILLMADIRDSFEGPNISEVKIFQNEIDNSYRAGLPSAPIPVGAIRLSARVPLGKIPGIVNHDVEISSNHIRGSSTAGIVANYTQRLTIDNNRFENIQGPVIVMNRVRNASIINNASTPPAKVEVDPSSRESVLFKQNAGFFL